MNFNNLHNEWLSKPRIVLGMMSGTSLDGIDICASSFSISQNGKHQFELLCWKTYPMDQELRENIKHCIQQEISMQLNKEKIGKNYKTLFDRKEGDYFIGRTEFDSPDVDNEVLVKANNDTYIRIGDFETVRITDASDFDLYGELIKS